MDKSINITETGQLGFADINIVSKTDLPPYKCPNYKLLRTEQEVKQVLPSLLTTKAFGLDIETSGLDPHSDSIRLIQLAADNMPVYIIDVEHVPNIAILTELFAAKKPVKIIHNAVFELKFLSEKYHIPFGTIFDTMLASKLVYNGYGYRHNLAAVTERELGCYLSKTMQTSNWSSDLLSSLQLDYAAKDAAVLLELRQKLIKKIVEQKLVYVADLEFKCTKAMASMMYNGIKVDKLALKQKYSDLLNEKQQIKLQIKNFFGEINLQSPQQIEKALSKKGIQVTSTRESALKEYALKYPEIELLQRHKSIVRIISSALRPLQERTNLVTGRVHANFSQIGASSGRMSCGGPNVQNIPRGDFRKIIVAPPHKKLIIADYSQVELRIISEISQDPQMIKAFVEGKDIHRITASIVSNKQEKDVTKTDRQKAKAVNFGLVFGMGSRGLVKYAKSSYGVDMNLAEAEYIRASFFKTYKGIASWHKKVANNGDNMQYNETLSGRKRYYKTDQRFVSELYNTPVQGTGADILKMALIRLFDRLKGTSGKLTNCVHDEIVVECNENDASIIAKIVRQEMVAAGEEYIKSVPIEVEVLVAQDWSEK